MTGVIGCKYYGSAQPPQVLKTTDLERKIVAKQRQRYRALQPVTEETNDAIGRPGKTLFPHIRSRCSDLLNPGLKFLARADLCERLFIEFDSVFLFQRRKQIHAFER